MPSDLDNGDECDLRAEGHEIEPTPVVNRSVHIEDSMRATMKKSLKEVKLDIQNKVDQTPIMSDLTVSP